MSGSLLADQTAEFHTRVGIRVARWWIFEPKIPFWVNFGGYCYVGLFYGHLLHFTVNCKFCGHLVYFFSFWCDGQEQYGNPGRNIHSGGEELSQSSV
jgi:hypothetical protein